ncbi:MAG: hypothetical protein WBP16_09160 [Ferruginibacter sp.]
MKKIMLFICLFSIVLLSCKKEKPVQVVPGVAGFWKGKYNYYTTGYPDKIMYVLFRSDSTVRVYQNNADTALASKANGTFTIKGDSVIANYVFTTYAFNALQTLKMVVNPSFTFMEGITGLGSATIPIYSLGPAFLAKQ